MAQTQQREKEYLSKADEVLGMAKGLFQRSDWRHILTKKDTVLYALDLPDICPIPAYMVEATFPKPKEEMVNKVWGVKSEEMAKANDPKLTMWKEVERGANWKVLSQFNSMIWPIWPRHTVFNQTRVDQGDNTYLVGFSVDHPDVPQLVKTHVRSHVHLSVYNYTDNHNGTTTVRRITLIDPKGVIPISLITMYSGNLVDLFNSWK